MVIHRRRNRQPRRDSNDDRENTLIVDAELAKGKFSYIYRNSFQKEIRIKHCIPLFKSRRLVQSAIRHLQKVFDVDESGVIGYIHAGGLKVVVKIPEGELELVKDYLIEQDRSDVEARSLTYNENIEWFGIVDGEHKHSSLLKREIARPDPFQDFKWVVTVIQWQPISDLRAFSRARNILQSTHIVEMTLFDTIQGLHEIAHEKSQLAGESLETFLKRRGVITEIADEFCGGSKYSKQTTRTLAGAALRIKPHAMAVLGQIMTEEDTALAKQVLERNTSEAHGEEDIFDTRVYKNLISTNTLRGATAFLNADEEDQVNALLKLKFAYEDNDFKGFQAPRLNKETERSSRARHQIHLMNKLMCREKWLEELADVQRKLLASSIFDSELDDYKKHSDQILPSLILEYRERMPLEAGLRWRLYIADLARRSKNEGNEKTADQQERKETKAIGSIAPEALGAEADENDAEELCPLERLNVTCLNVTLERYLTDWKAGDEKFDIITGDPSQLQLNGTCKVSIDGQKADKYVGVIKQLLREHGWVFLYTRAVDYSMWDKAFRANCFEPLDYPWPMVRNTDTVQMNTSPLPQSVTELLIGARKKGAGRPSFQPNITSDYERRVSSRKRKFAIMDCCSEPPLKLKKPNTREPLRTNQRAVEPIAEFLDTFCPPKGCVLDAFAGTLETVKACYATGRKYVALEADNQCFEIALQTLKENAVGYLAENSTCSAEPIIEADSSSSGEEESVEISVISEDDGPSQESETEQE